MASTPRSIRLDDELWARLDQHARSMNLTTNLVASAVLTHWARLAEEDRDAAARLVTRPDLTLRQHLDALDTERNPSQQPHKRQIAQPPCNNPRPQGLALGAVCRRQRRHGRL